MLFERASNPFLQQVTDWLGVHSRRLNTLYFGQDVPTTASYNEHLDLISALRAGDEQRASTLAKQNILRTIDVVAVTETGRSGRNGADGDEADGRAGRVAAHPAASWSSRRTTSSSTSMPRPGPAGIATRPSATVSGVVSRSVRIGFSNVSHSIRPP